MSVAISRGTLSVAALAMSLLVLPAAAVAQDDGAAEASPVSEVASSDEAVPANLPAPLGQCAGAELRVLAVDAPFGEPLAPFDDLVAREATTGSAEIEYLLPDGAMNGFISFSVPDAAELSLQGTQILEVNPGAPDINPDVHYANATVQGIVFEPVVAERTSTIVDLNVVDEESYLGLWAGWGVDLADFADPPYAYGDHLRVFFTFDLDGVNYSWSSRSDSTDCFER